MRWRGGLHRRCCRHIPIAGVVGAVPAAGLDQLRFACRHRPGRLAAGLTRPAAADDVADRWRRTVVSPRNTGERFPRFVSGHDQWPVCLGYFSSFTRFFHYTTLGYPITGGVQPPTIADAG